MTNYKGSILTRKDIFWFVLGIFVTLIVTEYFSDVGVSSNAEFSSAIPSDTISITIVNTHPLLDTGKIFIFGISQKYPYGVIVGDSGSISPLHSITVNIKLNMTQTQVNISTPRKNETFLLYRLVCDNCRPVIYSASAVGYRKLFVRSVVEGGSSSAEDYNLDYEWIPSAKYK
jgi:hypothetical protein